jgi:predicted ribosome quality control (RQC) complex YloA/Tae2 family protein
MPIRYDSLLVEALGLEIADRWGEAPVNRLVLDRIARAARLEFGSGEALVCLLHPSAGFTLAAGVGEALGTGWSGGPPFSRGVAQEITFRRLHLTGVETPPDERLLFLDLGSGADRSFRLALELHTNQWNAVLVAERSGRIEAVLWQRQAGGRQLRPAISYQAPAGARRWEAAPPTLDEWLSLLTPLPPAERRNEALRQVAGVSAVNVESLLGEAAISGEPDALDAAYRRYLRARARRGEAWVLQRSWGAQPYPDHLGEAAERAPSLLEAMERAARQAGVWPTPPSGPAPVAAPGAGESAEACQLRETLQARLRAVRKRRSALQRQLQGPDAEVLRNLGHLLLARRLEVPRGCPRAELTDFDGTPREIELDPALGVVDNAERYYDRARRRERAARSLPARIRSLGKLEERLSAALVRVSEDGPSEDLWRLAGGRESETAGSRRTSDRGSGQRERGLPYRRLHSSGGLEIRVGRSARANDELTFHHAAPEDIWLHARQVKGAHVILRWGRRDQNPAQSDLIEAAMAAAVYSDARHSGVVAVDWTRRKYVRKPRKAAAGTVIPERVRTLFVQPDAKRIRSLAPDV